MAVFVAAYVLQPLAGSARGGYSSPGRRLSALQAERDRVLDSIQEIDMDHAMGKVPEEDYRRQRQALVLEGAEILRKIDELQLPPEAERHAKILTAREMELEAAIAQLRGKSLEAAPQVRAGQSDRESGSCPECGQVIFSGDRYCANCGAALEEQVA